MTDVADEVKTAWETVHEKLEDASTRVNREAFVEYCMNKVSDDSPKRTEYEAYLNKLFDTATALMLPSEKTDLGKHCFGYATILANEFYFDQPADKLSLKAEEKPDDRLADVRKALDADWDGVEKDEEGRVSMDGFVAYFMKKYTEKVAPESQEAYKAFLEKDFNSSLAMMLPDEKTNLGGHCFRYAAILAGEFYFDAANEATAGCGCSSPVTDILKVAQSKPKAQVSFSERKPTEDIEDEEQGKDEAPAADADADAEKKAAEEKAEAEKKTAEEKAAAEKAEAEKAAAAAADAEKADAEKADAEKADAEKAEAEAEKKAAEEKAEAEKKAADEKAVADKAAADKAAAEKAEAEKKAAEAAAAEPAAAPAAAGPAGKFPLEELQGKCPEGVPPTEKEKYLNDADFQTHLKMSREDFAKLPKWKQDGAKKAAKIF